MAVFVGLNNSAVHRLRFTRNELSKEEQKILEELEKLLNHENSYANYRNVFAVQRPPAIPFLYVIFVFVCHIATKTLLHSLHYTRGMCGVPKLTHSYSTHSAAFKRLGDHRRGQC
jgi:hypothetical protein